MNTWIRHLVACAALALSSGCASLTQTPSGFVELDRASWDYRATSAEGVVIAVRQLPHEPEGELSFWSRSIENELRARGGYELLGKEPLTMDGATRGELLRFRHVTEGAGHLYYVAVVLDEDVLGADDLYLVEVGGKEPDVMAADRSIRAALAKLRVD